MRQRSALAALSLAAVALTVVTACADGESSDAADADRKNAGATASTRILPAAACTAVPKAGRIFRSGYELSYSRGTMKASVEPKGDRARCLEFAKSGRADPNVPPDTLLFTFAGGRGEGAQIEFLAVDLAGAVLPWPTGASARVPGSPINATVGVSVGGSYFTSSTCTVRLQTVTDERAAGRFECRDAIAQLANPFDPDDDITYESAQPHPLPKSATLSGLFEIEP